jgi:hypothetical protein
MARELPEVRAEASVITARADGYRTSLGPSGNGGLVGCPTKRYTVEVEIRKSQKVGRHQ